MKLLVVVGVVVGVVLSGGTRSADGGGSVASSPGSGALSGSSSATSSSSPGVGSSGGARARIKVVADYRIRGWASVEHLSLLDHYVVFSACWHCRENAYPDELVAIDRRSGRQFVVARTGWRGGQLDWSEGTGDTIVYTDQNQEQSDTDQDTIWALYARRLPDGPVHVLASSHGRLRSDLPTPRAGGDNAIWYVQDPDDQTRADIWVTDLSTFHSTLVGHGYNPSELGVDGTDALWSTAQGDVIATSIDSPSPRAIYTGGHAAFARLSPDGLAVWAEPQDNDTESLWERPLSADGTTREILKGINYQTVPGEQFAAYMGDDDTIVNLSSGIVQDLTDRAFIPAHVAVDGPYVAFGISLGSTGPPVVLRIDQVTYPATG